MKFTSADLTGITAANWASLYTWLDGKDGYLNKPADNTEQLQRVDVEKHDFSRQLHAEVLKWKSARFGFPLPTVWPPVVPSGSNIAEWSKVFNPKKPFTIPITIVSGSVASPYVLGAISDDFKLHLQSVNADDLHNVMIRLAIMGADIGTSDKTIYPQKLLRAHYQSLTDDVVAHELVDIIKNHCTFRQYCMAYARVVWNYFNKEKRPPANYAKWGLTDENRYVGFDFFDGVQNGAAIPVPLMPQPTNDQQTAATTVRDFHIYRAQQAKGTQLVTITEVTGGKRTSNVPLLTLPATR